jgi:hypothetical protein
MNRREGLVLGRPLRINLRADGYLVVDGLFAPEEVKKLVDNFTRMVRYRVVSTRRAPRALTDDMEAVHHAVMLDPLTEAGLHAAPDPLDDR